MAKFRLTLEMDIDLNAVRPDQLNQVMKERLTEHMSATFLTGFTGAKLKSYKLDVRHVLPIPRILTLAQLEQMPLGTVVSPVVINLTDENKAWADFDCQGVLKVKPPSRLTSRDSWMLNFTPVQPDVHINDGRVVTHKGEHSYCYPNENWPHRFVLWEE